MSIFSSKLLKPNLSIFRMLQSVDMDTKPSEDVNEEAPYTIHQPSMDGAADVGVSDTPLPLSPFSNPHTNPPLLFNTQTIDYKNPFSVDSRPPVTSGQANLTSVRSSHNIRLGKGGKVGKAGRTDLLRKSTLKSCHEKG